MHLFRILSVLTLLLSFAVPHNLSAEELVSAECKGSGKISLLLSESFTSGVDRLNVLFELSTGRKKLKLRSSARRVFQRYLREGRLSSGDLVTIAGRKSGSHCLLRSASSLSVNSNLRVGSESLDQAEEASDQKVLAISVAFSDAEPSCTNQALSNAIFGESGSAKSYLKETTASIINLSGSLIGPLRIPFLTNQETDPYDWADAVDQIAISQGYNLEEYDRIVYFLPPGVLSSWQGWATIGGSPSRAWIKGCNPGVIAHELGHNNGLLHSETPGATYGDRSCVMGGAASSMPHLNAPQKYRLGVIESTQIQAPGDYTISALAIPRGSAQYPQALTISVPGNANTYFISFRNGAGLDSALSPELKDRVSLHSHAPDGKTVLYGTLSVGQALADSTNGILVRMLSRTADSATLRLSYAPFRLRPIVSIDSPDQVGFPGLSNTFLVEIRNRDSGALPDSRFNLRVESTPGFQAELSSEYVIIPPASSTFVTVRLAVPSDAADRLYPFSVIAEDPERAWHSASAGGSLLVQGRDLTPPRVTIERPFDNSVVVGDLKLRVVADDLSGIALIGVFIDGELVKTCSALHICDASISLSSISAGEHTLTAAAIDGSPQENVGYSEVRQFIKP